MDIWKRSLERSLKQFVQDPNSAKDYLSHGVIKPNEKIDPNELAAWTALCLNFLNLDETLNKE